MTTGAAPASGCTVSLHREPGALGAPRADGAARMLHVATCRDAALSEGFPGLCLCRRCVALGSSAAPEVQALAVGRSPVLGRCGCPGQRRSVCGSCRPGRTSLGLG